MDLDIFILFALGLLVFAISTAQKTPAREHVASRPSRSSRKQSNLR